MELLTQSMLTQSIKTPYSVTTKTKDLYPFFINITGADIDISINISNILPISDTDIKTLQLIFQYSKFLYMLLIPIIKFYFLGLSNASIGK